jgi:hypothetical protein
MNLRQRLVAEDGAIALATLAFMMAVGLGLLVMLWGIGYATGAYNQIYLGTQQAAYAAASAEEPQLFNFDTADSQPQIGCATNALVNYQCSSGPALDAAEQSLADTFNNGGASFDLTFLPSNDGTLRLTDENYQPDPIIYAYQMGLASAAQEARCSLQQGSASASTPSTSVLVDNDPDSQTYGALLCWQISEHGIIYPAETDSGVVVRTEARLQVPPGCQPSVIFCPTYEISTVAVATLSQPQANNNYSGQDYTGPSQTVSTSGENTLVQCPYAAGPTQTPTAGKPYGFYNYSTHTLIVYAFANSSTAAQVKVDGQDVATAIDQGNGQTDLYEASKVMSPALVKGDSVSLTFQSSNSAGLSPVTQTTFITPPDGASVVGDQPAGHITDLPPCPDGTVPSTPPSAPADIISSLPSYNGTTFSLASVTQNSKNLTATITANAVTTTLTTADSGTQANYQDWTSAKKLVLVNGETVDIDVTATGNDGKTTTYDFVWQVVADNNPQTPTLDTAPSLPTLTVGQPATVDAGSWEDATSYSYQWQECAANGQDCRDIEGASSKTYTPTTAQASSGDVVQVAVTASNANGSSTAISNQQPVTTNGVTTSTTG